jgi:hypothetical protein
MVPLEPAPMKEGDDMCLSVQSVLMGKPNPGI